MSTRRTTPEGEVLKAVLDALKLRGVYAWRNNSGALFNPAGRPVRFGKVGSADVFGLLFNGRFLAIEVKAPGREGTLTEAQWEFLCQVKARGGVAMVASDVADVWKMLDELQDDPERSFPLPPTPGPKAKRKAKAKGTTIKGGASS